MAEREDALLAAFPRELDEDALGVLVGPDRAGEVFRRLRRHPFVRESRGRLTYDDVVREAMVRYSRGRSPERFAAGNRSLARHYLARREGLGGGTAPAAVDDEWRSLLVDECYHRLCGGPRSALPAVLAWGEELCAAGAPAALAWLDMFADAERDTDSGLLREWWQKLAPFADAVRGVDAEGLRRALEPRPGHPWGGASVPMGGGGGNRGARAVPDVDQDVHPNWLVEEDDVWSGEVRRSAPPVIGE
ncbi:hypothetical protein [Saccharopolyspora sp. NPDC002578]